MPGKSFDASRITFRVVRQADAQDVVMVCLDCGDEFYGDLDDGIGKGEPGDNTLDRILFVADEHQTFYCKR